ncbi:DUF1360 domain-containing protein [Saccharothrix sp.]|uniref:DUF1360 domain-containing protein n=1 Tax=Saccharothrix sp. TaxID=1873460 RepID=UPI0028128661|nr:DUF1360 domain-containing protein [Saccharothrix sp.]
MGLSAPFRRTRDAHARDGGRPLGGYLVSLAAYAALAGGAVVLGRRRGVRLPDRVRVADVVLLAVATHKASRLLTKASVTAVLRAPFTRYESPAGEGEVNESVRGEGVRHAVGELVTCPFCAGVWVAGFLTAGHVLAPRATGLAVTALTAVAASDWLHLGYDRVKQAARG